VVRKEIKLKDELSSTKKKRRKKEENEKKVIKVKQFH